MPGFATGFSPVWVVSAKARSHRSIAASDRAIRRTGSNATERSRWIGSAWQPIDWQPRARSIAPLSFHEPVAKIIGAAHAGWRGALAGIAEAVVAQMMALGAERRRIRAAIGPCIAQRSYEVGPEFPQPFLADNQGAAGHFVRAPRDGHFLFDLGGYLADRIIRAGIATVEVVPHDTVAEEVHFFSYRRSCLRSERSFGLGLSAVVLEE